jgi:hypothetical protein
MHAIVRFCGVARRTKMTTVSEKIGLNLSWSLLTCSEFVVGELGNAEIIPGFHTWKEALTA